MDTSIQTILDKHDNSNNEWFYDNETLIQALTPYNSTIFRDTNLTEKIFGKHRKRFYKGKPVLPVTQYQSFYPENYFQFWEILLEHKLLISDNPLKIVAIDHAIKTFPLTCSPLGNLEACIRFRETNNNYIKDQYVRLPLQNPERYISDVKFNDTFLFETHNFHSKKNKELTRLIKQTTSFYKDNRFDLIMLPLFDETVSSQTIINLLVSLQKLNGNAILPINLNHIRVITPFLQKLYDNVTVYKPTASSSLDPTVYVILQQYNGQTVKLSTRTKKDKLLDKPLKEYKKCFQKFVKQKIKSKPESNSLYYPINKKQIEEGIKWCDKYDVLVNYYYRAPVQTIYYIDDYHKNIVDYELKSNENNNLTIQPIDSNDTIVYNRLQSIKRGLNKHKRLIDSYEQFVNNDIDMNVIDWNKLTDNVDMYRGLKKYISWKYNAELTTNAWTKLYEIIDTYKLFDEDVEKLTTFHLCEAPGAFVASLNHYLETKTQVKQFDWYAQSLNPWNQTNIRLYPSLLKDSLGIMQSHHWRWLYGKTNTGDITDPINIKSYRQNRKIKKLDLMTSDCGLKVTENMFNEQERFVGKVNFGQVMGILYLLPEGKNCVFKTFVPFAETFTVSLLYLLTCLFEKLTVIKPITSHPSSSEVYITGVNYKGANTLSENEWNNLFAHLSDFNIDRSLIAEKDIPKQFVDDLVKCSQLFTKKQIDSIQRSMYYRFSLYSDIDRHQELSDKKNEAEQFWIDKFNLEKLDDNHRKIKVGNKTKKTAQQNRYK
jgi:23S rRNA U2552 (ribose-2'-O)-methylase RlmE/FtsJ